MSLKRRLQRRQGVVTTAREGDVALACHHVGPEDDLGDELHLIALDGEIAATPSEGSDAQGIMLRAKWILLCDACHAAHPEALDAAVHHFQLPRDVEAVSFRSTE